MTHLCARSKLAKQRLCALFQGVKEECERRCAVAEVEELLKKEEGVGACVGVGWWHDCAGRLGALILGLNMVKVVFLSEPVNSVLELYCIDEQ